MSEKQPPSEEKAPAQPAKQTLQTEGLMEPREKELSPETIEKIMEKVRDINQAETAVHSITQHSRGEKGLSHRLETLQKNFQEGILGSPPSMAAGFQPAKGEITKEKWAELTRKREGAFVYFNILGKDIDSVDESFWLGRNPIVIIFDIASFKEELRTADDQSRIWQSLKEKKRKTHTFTPTGPPAKEWHSYPEKKFGSYTEMRRSEKRGVIPHADNGYIISSRVAPRWFRGVVFRVDRPPTPAEFTDMVQRRQKDFRQPLSQGIMEQLRAKQVEDTSEKEKENRTKEIVSVMKKACVDKEERLLPVYDIHGNLYWPKKMTYEEVKQFVAELEEEKEQKGKEEDKSNS